MLLRQLNPSKSLLKTSINILKIILSHDDSVFTERCAPGRLDYLSRDGSVFVSIKDPVVDELLTSA